MDVLFLRYAQGLSIKKKMARRMGRSYAEEHLGAQAQDLGGVSSAKNYSDLKSFRCACQEGLRLEVGSEGE